MTERILTLAIVACLIAIPASAQTAAGRWNATIETGQGPLELVFKFEINGSTLTGTAGTEFMGPTPISDGSIMDNELSFALRFEDPAVMSIYYTGVVEGDEMTLTTTFEVGGPPMDTFTATRDENPE